jgi:hypothetical protein
MSFLHRNEPPKAAVNDALAGKGHWLGRHFRVNVWQNPYHSGAVHCASHWQDNGQDQRRGL